MPRATPVPRRRHAPLTPALSPLSIVHDILTLQLTIIRHNTRLAIRTRGTDAIHDLRVAIRRFRNALRVFEPFLRATSAPLIRRRLLTANRRLGLIRDAQLWAEFIAQAAEDSGASLDPRWQHCIARAELSRARRERAIATVLGAPRFQNLVRRATRLVQDEIPALRRKDHHHDGRLFLVGKLLKAYQRLHRSRQTASFDDVEMAHRFRRRCRRSRYLAEFAHPILGHKTEKLSKRLKRVADALGDLHDAEVQREHLHRMAASPEGLILIIERRRKKAQLKFEESWRRLFSPRFRRALLESFTTTKERHP